MSSSGLDSSSNGHGAPLPERVYGFLDSNLNNSWKPKLKRRSLLQAHQLSTESEYKQETFACPLSSPRNQLNLTKSTGMKRFAKWQEDEFPPDEFEALPAINAEDLDGTGRNVQHLLTASTKGLQNFIDFEQKKREGLSRDEEYYVYHEPKFDGMSLTQGEFEKARMHVDPSLVGLDAKAKFTSAATRRQVLQIEVQSARAYNQMQEELINKRNSLRALRSTKWRSTQCRKTKATLPKAPSSKKHSQVRQSSPGIRLPCIRTGYGEGDKRDPAIVPMELERPRTARNQCHWEGRMQRVRNIIHHGRPYNLVTGAKIEIATPNSQHVEYMAPKHPSFFATGWKKGWWH